MSDPEVLELVDKTHVVWRGQRLVYFGGCDYLRLSWHPEVRAALELAARKRCISVAASRITTGNDPVYPRLEAELARFFRFESAVLAPAGYMAPLGVAQALAGRFTHVLVDEKAHGCLRDAALLTEARILTFHHNAPADLARRVRRLGRKARLMVLTDGLSALEGSVPPLRDYLEVLPGSGTLLVDDAHGVGVLGRTGRGVLEHFGVDDPRVVLTLTLSKAFGCQGGVVAGPGWLCDAIWKRSHVFASSTPLPLPLAAAARASLRIIRSGRAMRRQLETNVRCIGEAFVEKAPGSNERPGPMFTIAPQGHREQASLIRSLLAARIYPSLIRYANGPASCFFRFAVSSAHTKTQVACLRDVLAAYFSRHP